MDNDSIPTSQPSSDPAKSFFWELVKVVVISLAIIIPVRMFVMQPFIVQGGSMEPNFLDCGHWWCKEYLVISKLSYRLHPVRRGDVVVFNSQQLKEHLIKRVIGLPGETIEIRESEIRVANTDRPEGFIVAEGAYLDANVYTSGAVQVALGADEYFVLGDNRTGSYDSRFFGPIKRAEITGRAWARLWPIKEAALLQTPEY